METKQFLKLDFNFVAKILSSSQLDITSELEVCYAALDWLEYNNLERRRYARDLLLKIRLPLLTYDQLDFVLRQFKTFSHNKECLQLIKDISANRKVVNWKDLKCRGTIRHCNQNLFDVLSFKKDSFKFIRLDESKKDLKRIRETPRMPLVPKTFVAVYLKGFVYIFGCIFEHRRLAVQGYSLKSGRWEYIEQFMGIQIDSFCACALTDDYAYLLGGMWFGYYGIGETDGCLKFDAKYGSLKPIRPMNTARATAACTAFEGRVVVCGGHNNQGQLDSNTVEAYDWGHDKWSYMPSMIHGRYSHNLVAVKNKLFVVGGEPTACCEVYDSCCKTFVAMKSPSRHFKLDFATTAVLIGNRIVLFRRDSQIIAFYDIEKDQWSEDTYEIRRRYTIAKCIRVPQI